MDLIGIIKRSARAPLLAGALVLSSCGVETLLNNASDSSNRNQIVESLIQTDSEYEPELESKIEQTFDVNVLGMPEFLTEANLQEAYEKLSFFKPEQIAGLNVVLGEDGSNDPNVGGQYDKYNKFGPTIFASVLSNAQFVDGAVYVFKPGAYTDILRHEIFHHIHCNLSQRAEFDQSWYDIRTVIPSNGELLNISTKEAIRALDRKDNFTWRITDEEGIERNFGFGIFGFASPYGIGNETNPAERDNEEDVATFTDIIDSDGINLQFTGGIAYWDLSFDVTPYLNKIDLLKKYGFIDDSTAQAMSTRMREKDNAFSDIRDPNFFSQLESCVLEIGDPNAIRTGNKGFYDLASNSRFDDTFIVHVFKYGSSSDPDWAEKPYEVRSILGREYKNEDGESAATAYLMEYSANLLPNGTLETRNCKVNVNYPTDPVDNSSLEQKFRNVMESSAWQEEYQALAEGDN
jgi:hypothetical protein